MCAGLLVHVSQGKRLRSFREKGLPGYRVSAVSRPHHHYSPLGESQDQDRNNLLEKKEPFHDLLLFHCSKINLILSYLSSMNTRMDFFDD